MNTFVSNMIFLEKRHFLPDRHCVPMVLLFFLHVLRFILFLLLAAGVFVGLRGKGVCCFRQNNVESKCGGSKLSCVADGNFSRSALTVQLESPQESTQATCYMLRENEGYLVTLSIARALL